MATITLPVTFGVLALAVDVSYALSEKNVIQGVADNAARAATQVKSQSGSTTTMVEEEAYQVAAMHGYRDNGRFGSGGNADVFVKINSSSTPIGGNYQLSDNAVEVKISKSAPQFFGSFLSVAARFVGVRAVADYSYLPCLAALNPSNGQTESSGITVSGANTLLKADCPVVSNRNDPNSSFQSNAGRLSTKLLLLKGGVSAANRAAVIDGEVLTDQPLYINPFAHLIAQIPTATYAQTQSNASTLQTDPYYPRSIGASCTSDGKAVGSEVVLKPGYYKDGFSFKNNYMTNCSGKNVRLQDGVYYVNGDFVVNLNTESIIGEKVTIVLLGNSDLRVNGGSIVLGPTKSGTWNGISIIGGGSVVTTGTGSAITSSSAGLNLEGNVVLPSKNLTMNGGFAPGSRCFTMITWSATLAGMSANGGLSGGCPTVNGNPNTVRAAGLIH